MPGRKTQQSNSAKRNAGVGDVVNNKAHHDGDVEEPAFLVLAMGAFIYSPNIGGPPAMDRQCAGSWKKRNANF